MCSRACGVLFGQMDATEIMPQTTTSDICTASGPRKRPRLDEEEASSWTRHPKLYMQDGTIVLLAGSTVFRTYSGLLSMHSEVFSGMCSLSAHQPTEVESYDGCPLVRLSDDPNDLAYFLRVLVDFSFFPAVDQAISFGAVSGILRLSTKYLVQSLRERAIAHLSRLYTTDHDKFIHPQNNEVNVFGSREDSPHPFELISLLRECSVLRLFPHAFLKAFEKGFDALVSGDQNGGEVIRLSPEDTRVALMGWRSIHAAILNVHIRSGVAAAGRRCEFDERCAPVRRARLQDILVTYSNSPHIHFGFPVTEGHAQGGCPRCVFTWREDFRREVRELWPQIPGYLGLPSWTELLKED